MLDIAVAVLVFGLALSMLIDAFVWKELQELRLDLSRCKDEINELNEILEAYQNFLSPPPVSESQAIEIVSEYTGWNMSYLKKYNTSAVLWYAEITNSTFVKGFEYLHKVLKPVSDYRPKLINENRTLCYVWVVTIDDPELKYPIPHGVNWYVNAYNGEVIDIFLHH